LDSHYIAFGKDRAGEQRGRVVLASTLSLSSSLPVCGAALRRITVLLFVLSTTALPFNVVMVTVPAVLSRRNLALDSHYIAFGKDLAGEQRARRTASTLSPASSLPVGGGAVAPDHRAAVVLRTTALPFNGVMVSARRAVHSRNLAEYLHNALARICWRAAWPRRTGLDLVPVFKSASVAAAPLRRITCWMRH